MSPSVASAEKVLRRFLEAGMARDEPAMRACLNKASREAGKFDPSSGPPPGTELSFGEATEESADAIVIPVLAGPGREPMLRCVVVREEGDWKVDLATTIDRMMGGMMEQVGQAVGTAVEAMGQALGDALTASFGQDENVTRDWSSAELAPRAEELMGLPKMTPLPGVSRAFSEAVGSRVEVMASDELLSIGGEEGRQTLIDWFEGPLFAGWAEMLRRAAEYAPLKGRLRAMRLEYATWFDNKAIVLDGSDLLYRMRLPESEGFYQDDWVAWCIDGVLAGLPAEIDPNVAGKRMVLTDHERGDFDIYKDRVVPAHMCRISELVGRRVELEVDWLGIHDPASAVRQWQRWGLNRIYGAVALACAGGDLAEQIRRDLKRITLRQRSGVEERFARYEHGILELSFHDYGGEPVGFYEQALFNVLAGDPILPTTPTDASEGAPAKGTAATDGSVSTPDDDPLFASAMESTRGAEPTWREQVKMLFGGRPVALELDWACLQGRYPLIQPFVHRALTGTMEALGMVAFDPAHKSRLETVRRVVVTGRDEEVAPSVALDGGDLTFTVGLAPGGDERPPSAELAGLLTDALGSGRRFSSGMPERAREPEPGQAVLRFTGDLYQVAGKYMDELEAELRRGNAWPAQPAPDPLVVKGAFGCENMPFEYWLAWVLVPRVREIVATRGEFPERSATGAYAVRALDGAPHGSEVVSILSEFDWAIERR